MVRSFRLLPVIALLIGAYPFMPTALAAPRADGGTSAYVVVLKDTVADPAAVAARLGRANGIHPRFVYSHALKGFAADVRPEAVSRLEANPLVSFLSPDAPFAAAANVSPTCPFPPPDLSQQQCLPTGVDRVDGDRSNARSGDGRGSVGINVAVIDTGIEVANPELNVAGGTNCYRPGNPSFNDDNGHGTHVSGILAARDNAQGVVGVAPGANLYAVKVLSKQGSGTAATVLCGIDWATATRTDDDPTNDIAVANMSLLGKGSDDGNCGRTNKDAIHMAICNSVAAGVTYAVAAGNAGADLQTSIPAAYDEVLTVTAMTDFDGAPGGAAPNVCAPQAPYTDDSVAFFSNFATLPADQAHTIAAPGVCILSTVPVSIYGVPYANFFGTSMATPHVAGTIALCIAGGQCAGLTPVEIVHKLVADAAAYSGSNPGYGFVGDPIRPIPGSYFGYLLRAALY